MASYYHQKMQDIFKRYQEAVSSDPVNPKEVGAWAMAKRLWAPRPVDMQSQFAADLAEALGEEFRTDKAGRRYRSKLAVTTRQDRCGETSIRHRGRTSRRMYNRDGG
jgi:hypothetical protein